MSNSPPTSWNKEDSTDIILGLHQRYTTHSCTLRKIFPRLQIIDDDGDDDNNNNSKVQRT
jgi:hypothetical protein